MDLLIFLDRDLCTALYSVIDLLLNLVVKVGTAPSAKRGPLGAGVENYRKLMPSDKIFNK